MVVDGNGDGGGGWRWMVVEIVGRWRGEMEEMLQGERMFQLKTMGKTPEKHMGEIELNGTK